MWLIWPVPSNTRISQRFGENPELYRPHGLLAHEGNDFAVPVGTPVRAMHDGTVDLAYSSSYGLYAMIYGVEVMTLYAHLSSAKVTVGQRVEGGQVFVLSGNTGNSTGPHLHLGFCPLPRNFNNGYKGWEDVFTYPGVIMVDLEKALADAIASRFDDESIQRLFEEGDKDIADGEALIERGKQKHRQARLRHQQRLNLKNGVAYRPEIDLGGPKPEGWEG